MQGLKDSGETAVRGSYTVKRAFEELGVATYGSPPLNPLFLGDVC